MCDRYQLFMHVLRPCHWLRHWALAFSIILFYTRNCSGHGRLIEPPSRATAWRYGFQTPPDYNDHELYCGGFTRQWKRNGGKCGECGDAWDVPEPRPHEYGGQWGQGVIVRRYNPGAEMSIRVELTASHMGYFEFRLCPEPSAKQQCLDKHLLKIMGGAPAVPTQNDLDTRFYPRNGSRIYEIKSQLPEIECVHCVLQWRYIAGNNWGICPDGNGAVGCGPQEEFRACADIQLGHGVPTTIRPLRPTLPPKVYAPTTETVAQEDSFDGFDYTSLFIGVLVLIIIGVITGVIFYFYRYKRQIVKDWLGSIEERICRKQKYNSPIVVTATPIAIVVPANEKIIDAGVLAAPPIPPPRTKRHASNRETPRSESSVA